MEVIRRDSRITPVITGKSQIVVRVDKDCEVKLMFPSMARILLSFERNAPLESMETS